MSVLFRNLSLFTSIALTSCAGIRQFADDPASSSNVPASYQQYFNADLITKYEMTPTDQRLPLRDTIAINRMLGYDATYDVFKKQLLTEGNSFNIAGDLTVLVLSGLGATTGAAATKAALAAASAGIIGAKTAISSDLFYQRTLPALIAQMDANRATVKATILTGLSKPDNEYPLVRVLVDLQQLSDAGSMIGAIGSITQDAGVKKSAADARLTFARTADYKLTLQTRKTITEAIGKLTGPQILQLIQKADAITASDPKAQAVLKSFDRATLFANVGQARTALQLAVTEGDGDPATLQKWAAAISAITAGN